MSEDFVAGIVMATVLEAEPFIKGLSLRQCEKEPFAVYENNRIRVIISGIGKANAAMSCTYLIMKFHPSDIFNLGAAGATGPHVLGECYHIGKVIEPDRPCLGSVSVPAGSELPESSDNPSLSTILADSQAGSDPFHVHIPQRLEGFPTATLATRDRPVKKLAQRKETASYAELVDMEGAAVVQTCQRFHTNCYLFKFVSDTSESDETVNIRKNIEQYRDIFYAFFQDSVLPFMKRK